MAFGRNYDLRGTGYMQEMTEKNNRYSALVRNAERTNRDNGGKPTKQEAKYYMEAGKVCEEIMNLNLSQRDLYEKWRGLKLACEAHVKRIVDILNPVPEEEPEPVRATQKVSNSRNQVTGAQEDSDFQTEHATKDVPKEKIAKWFKNIDDIQESGFDEVIGREEMKMDLLDAASGFGWDKTDSTLVINPVKCIFLYGPSGTGKSHLIKCFAKELSKRVPNKKEKFSFMHLTGGDIHESYVGMAEKNVKTAFAVAQEHEPCLLFIDEIDNLCVSRDSKAESHERRLTVEFMQSYDSFIKSGKRVVFMGATNHPGKLDKAMLDRFTLVRVPLPEEKERDAFFLQMLDRTKKNPSAAKLFLEPGFTTAEMADATDNYSYRELEQLRDTILVQLKKQAIQENQVLDQDGNMDQQATDERASRAILAGQILITREMFKKAQDKCPAEDKSDVQAELEAFENGRRKGQQPPQEV